MLVELHELLDELRTKEAAGEGTDVRLVLLEALVLKGQLERLDVTLAGDSDLPGLLGGLRDPDDPLLCQLVNEWEGFELEECTRTLRECEGLIRLVTPGVDG